MPYSNLSTTCARLLNRSLENVHVSHKVNFQLVLAKFSGVLNGLEREARQTKRVHFVHLMLFGIVLL